MLIGIVVGTLVWGRGRMKSGGGRKRGPGGGGGFFQLGDGKEGFLNGGGGAYGKAD